MYYVLAIFVTFPMLLSVASFVWSRFFGDPDHFPGSARLHTLLILSQVVCTTIVFGFHSSISFLMISGLYVIQGIGVVYFIRKKGRVDCGCLGSQVRSKLGYRLVSFNFLLGLMGLGFSNPQWFVHSQSLVMNGLLMEGMVLLLSLLLIVGIPDALHTINIYRDIAAPYYPKIKKSQGG